MPSGAAAGLGGNRPLPSAERTARWAPLVPGPRARRLLRVTRATAAAPVIFAASKSRVLHPHFPAGSNKTGAAESGHPPLNKGPNPDYSFAPPRAPARQLAQTPKPLPLPRIAAQRPPTLASSPALKVAGVKAVSVTL